MRREPIITLQSNDNGLQSAMKNGVDGEQKAAISCRQILTFRLKEKCANEQYAV